MGALDAGLREATHEVIDVTIDTPSTITRKARTYDGSAPASEVTTTAQIKFVLDSYKRGEVDNDTVLRSDVKALASAVSFDNEGFGDPAVRDSVTFADGGVWVVKSAIPYKSGDEVALWELQLRK